MAKRKTTSLSAKSPKVSGSRFDFCGSYVAIVTPFSGGKVDHDALEALVETQIAQGTKGIVPLGTTGEAWALDQKQYRDVANTVIKVTAGRVPVFCGSGTNSTDGTIAYSKIAKEAGADGLLVVTPYYNKPSQEGLFQHYKQILAAVDLPIILYNVPGRTGCKMTPETVLRLYELPDIVAIKEASGDLNVLTSIRRRCDIPVLSGDDALTLPMLALGAQGVISVVGNILPRDMQNLVDFVHQGKTEEARKLHYQMLPVMDAMFMDSNPIPVKTAMYMAGRIKLEFKLPLCPMSEENCAKLLSVLREYGFVNPTPEEAS
ncbi:MAG: 4-hydroxy-tetrahydrodipicolinate synthase [Planctomycetes bacterium]|nr:4-hydroxy-tetrahydrodipicolinate synthase [Planctomycetota bacterium]